MTSTRINPGLLFFIFCSSIFLFSLSLPLLIAQPLDPDVKGESSRDEPDFSKIQDALRKQLENRLKAEPENASTLAALSELALERRDWGDVKKWNKRILAIDAGNLEANYALGIAHRETGSFKALFLRKRDFDKSQNYFETVIHQDSSFRTVLLQRAWLERHRRHWKNAIVWGHRQIKLKPDNVKAQVGLFQLYRLLLVHVSTSKAEAWLAGRSSDWDRFATGELFRRTGELPKADSVFSDVLGQAGLMSRAPLDLSRVRLNLQRHQPIEANQIYWQTLESSQSEIDLAFLFEDAKYVFTDAELAEFQSLPDVQAKKDFLKRLWTKRELTPASSVKYRLVEHYRRLLQAEKDYWYAGVRTPANNPDRLQYLEFPNVHLLNHEFNDKGLIFIRHGEPDDIARTAGENVSSNESWLYHKRADRPKLIFHFLIADVGTGNNWRLASAIQNRTVLADRAGWDHSITRLVQSKSFGEFQSNLIQMSEHSREMVDFGMTHDFHTWSKDTEPLELPFQTSSFRGQDGKTRVELSWEIPATSSVSKDASSDVAEFETGFAVLNAQYDEAVHVLDSVRIQGMAAKLASRTQHYRFEVEPGGYQISFFARQEAVDRTVLGGEQFDYAIRSFGQTDLEMSDVVAALGVSESDAPGSVQLGDVFVRLNPAHEFDRSEPVFLYYEIYNLKLDESGIADYEIDIQISLLKKRNRGLGKVFGFLGRGGKKEVSISNRRNSRSSEVDDYISFDASKLTEGDYKVAIVVQDMLSSARVEQSTKLTLLRGKEQ